MHGGLGGGVHMEREQGGRGERATGEQARSRKLGKYHFSLRSRGTYRSFSETRQTFFSIHLSKLPAALLLSRYNKNKILSRTGDRRAGGGQ